MATKSSIEWTETTWNPLTGCSKVSLGCSNCYAEKLSYRLKAMGQANYIKGFQLSMHEHVLEKPFLWKKPQMVFVNSMSDLFHEKVPQNFIDKALNVMRNASWHTFQVLTKRSERLLELGNEFIWPDNVWMGVSVENADYAYRIKHLSKTGAKVKFLSLEPLLGPIPNLKLRGIDWVIVGGESGPKARPMNSSWVLDIRDQCKSQKVPFFFKQWGGVNKKKKGRILEGRTWDEIPALYKQKNRFRKKQADLI